LYRTAITLCCGLDAKWSDFWLKANQPDSARTCKRGVYGFAGAAGKGIGRQMAEFSLDEARNLGFTAMQFNFVVKATRSL